MRFLRSYIGQYLPSCMPSVHWCVPSFFLSIKFEDLRTVFVVFEGKERWSRRSFDRHGKRACLGWQSITANNEQRQVSGFPWSIFLCYPTWCRYVNAAITNVHGVYVFTKTVEILVRALVEGHRQFKQIDSKLPCVCSVRDHKWRQNVVRTKKWHTRRSRVCHWWHNLESICFI